MSLFSSIPYPLIISATLRGIGNLSNSCDILSEPQISTRGVSTAGAYKYTISSSAAPFPSFDILELVNGGPHFSTTLKNFDNGQRLHITIKLIHFGDELSACGDLKACPLPFKLWIPLVCDLTKTRSNFWLPP